MDVVRPRALRRGDTIAIVVPASPVPREPIERAIAKLQAMDFRVKTYGDLYREHGYLAGDDSTRADELMAAFVDAEVSAVFPARGGNGVTRLLDRLDYDAIAANPKILAGFSDMTALHSALQNRTGLVTFHSPHPKDGIGADDGMSDLTARTYWRALLADEYADDAVGYEIPLSAAEREAVVTMRGGKSRGRLVGGNLALVCAMMGTPYETSTAGNLLLLEDVNEPPYRIDRFLAQLKLAGKLQELAGVVLGQFTDCRPAAEQASLSLDQVFDDYFADLSIPIVRNYPTGHCRDNATVPLGVEAELDADARTIRLLNNPVLLDPS